MKYAVSFVFLLLMISFRLWAAENCNDAANTLAINQCMAKQSQQAERLLDKYFEASLKRCRENDKLSLATSKEKSAAKGLQQAQSQWLSYRKAQCSAVYQYWADGSIRNAMYLQCMLDLTRQRTHYLWQTYLTYMDSTPPALPDPKS
ncbi:lysozyme inhibitor LprI family protein [Dongshaea marina]|uniref:lysozyme inhibitor LprI family protein n=1 Tax=Dongshaea marina TaxID=2047966 RepID=UPI000D3ECFE5|nr:lysozyme inhibitor LprI family protein [Dongshaea marina]